MKESVISRPDPMPHISRSGQIARLTGNGRAQPWIWALVGIFVLWALLSAGAGHVSISSLSGIVGSAGLLTLVSIGQMFVITSGEGAVDLSIPSVMTLSGFVVTSLTNGQDSRLIIGLLAAIILGLAVGTTNALIVNRLRIPPIVATLAVGYILTTATLIMNRGFQTYAISPALAAFAGGRLFDIPTIFLFAIVITAAAAYGLHATVYGKSLSAVGQNRQGAYLAGIQVAATTRVAYILSSVLGAIGGMLLSGRVSGAFLEMGSPFALQSIGAVVVGGSSILGGRATALGTLFGSIFLVMIVTTMQVLRLAGGLQDVAQGILIIVVLAIAPLRSLNPKTKSPSTTAKSSS
jgi:ribose transport system permease protein